MRNLLGLCQWFHFEDRDVLQGSCYMSRILGLKHLRTGISWADWHRPGGEAWYDEQMARLAEAGLEPLVCVFFTPPSISEGNHCASPPRRLADFADFVAYLCDRYTFEAIELWNEPNNKYKWWFERYDPHWRKFGTMVADAALAAKGFGKTTVLGGMSPVDHTWLDLMGEYGALEAVDVIGVHGFFNQWNWDGRPWIGWDKTLAYLRSHTDKRIWITETGLATWHERPEKREDKYIEQQGCLKEVGDVLWQGQCERAYWYSLYDLASWRDAIEGYHVDEYEYHMGLITETGIYKPALSTFMELLRSNDADEMGQPQ